MLDNATKSVLDEITKAGLEVDNSLVKIAGTRNYFASVIEIADGYIAHCTDGVGSKVKHLIEHKMFDVIGKDCFAMCYNDILCVGANSMSFQDHITSSERDSHMIPDVVRGITEYCAEGYTLLTGGETEILKSTDFHISGSLTGIIAKDNLIDGTGVKPRDVIIGLPSSGIHSNGWTAISERMPELITPENLIATKLYNNEMLRLFTRIVSPSAVINITGGGFRNLERIPQNFQYEITLDNTPDIFKDLCCEFSHQELYTTFNMGIGLMVVVRLKDVGAALDAMEGSVVIGQVLENDRPNVVVNGQEIFFGDSEPYVFDKKEETKLGFSLMDN